MIQNTNEIERIAICESKNSEKVVRFLELTIESLSKYCSKKYAKQIIETAIRTGASIAGPVPLPTRRSVYTVVKSPHVYKMGGEAFEMRVHKRLIDITNATPKTIDSLQNLSLPSGVDAEIRM